MSMHDDDAPAPSQRKPGYYWIRHPPDNSKFVALLEDGWWFVPGVRSNIKIHDTQVMSYIETPKDA